MIVVDGVSLWVWRKNYAKIHQTEKPISFKRLQESLGKIIAVLKLVDGVEGQQRLVQTIEAGGVECIVVDHRYYNAHTIRCAQLLCHKNITGIVTSDPSFFPLTRDLGKKIYSSQFLSEPAFLEVAENENVEWLKSEQLFEPTKTSSKLVKSKHSKEYSI